MIETQYPVNYLKQEVVNSEKFDNPERRSSKQAQEFYELKRYRRFDSDDERNKNRELFSAIRNNDLQQVKDLLKAGVKSNIIDKNNKDNTPLHYAVERDKKEIVQALLQEKNVDIDAKNILGNTPLHIAVSKDYQELVKLLLDHEAKPNIMNNSNKTPLNLAKEVDNTNPNKQIIIQMLNEIDKSEDNIKHDQPLSNPDENIKPDINDISVFVERTIDQQDYEVWLMQEDIANIARTTYGWYGDDNNVIFEVIGSIHQLGKQLVHENLEKLISSKKQSLTFIVNLDNRHWVTLIITYRKQKFSAYYADPGAKKIPRKIRNKLQEFISDIIIIQPISRKQQGDKHNCGIYALENAKIINDKIKAGQTTNEEIKQALENFKPTSDDLKLMRIMFAKQLQRQKIYSDEVIENESKNRKLSLVKTHYPGEMSIANNDNEQKISRSKVLPLSRIYRKSGLVYSLHGDIYQLKLLMLFVKRALDKGYIFELATEMDNAEKFDDVVFRYKKKESDKWGGRFLQAKHKQDEGKSITINDLLTPKTEREFSLQKYFISYRKIKENREYTDQLNKDFVICTNIGFKFGDKKKNSELTISEDIFNKETDESDILNSELLQFKKEFSGREEIVSVLNDAPDLNKLAKVLIECVLDSKSISNDKSKNSPDENIFMLYQCALINKVIVKENHKLSSEFIDGKDLPPEIQNLRNAFRKQFDDRRKSFNLDIIPNIEDPEKFADEIVDLIKKPVGETLEDGVFNIANRRILIKKNFHKLAGHVLIIKDDGFFMFSTAFLNNDKDLPGNLNEFRKIFQKKVSEKLPHVVFDQLKFNVYKDFKACPEIYVDENNFWEKIKETKLKLFHNFGELDNNIESVDTLVEKFVSILMEEESQENNIIRIKRENRIISKNIEKLSRFVFIENNNEIRFRPTFWTDPQLPGNLNKFRTQLEAKMKQVNMKKSTLENFKFVINNFPKFQLPNDSINQIEKHIEEFLKDLKFAVNQPNEVKLGEVIKMELGREFNTYDSKNVYARFLEKILDWMKDKEGKYFTDEEGKDFFKEIKKEILGEIWFGVKDPVVLNIEREQKLEEVHKALQDNQNNDKVTDISQTACISGLGGIGKSELARQYANKYGNDYNNNVIWINAESTETMESSFRKLAKDSRLGIPIKDVDGQEKEIEALVQEIYRFFGQGKRKSLFIFDNAEKYDISDKTKNIGIKEFLPTMRLENKPHILITSRFQTWEKLKVINLEKFTETEAINFIQEALSMREDDDDVSELAKKLNYFPLALQQAVAFIRKKDEEKKNIDPDDEFTIQNYLKKFNGGEAQELLSFPLSNDISNLYPETTLTTWKVTFDHIKKNELLNGEQALEILDVIAYFAPDKIPMRMFSMYEDGGEKLEGAIQLLKQYSLINSSKSMFSVNSLVQLVIRMNSKDREKEILKRALKLFKDNIVYQIDKNFGPSYVNHAISVWRYASSHEELVKEIGNLAIFIVSELDKDQRSKEAISFGNEALKMLEKILGSNHPSFQLTLDVIASIFFKSGIESNKHGNYDDAFEKFSLLLNQAQESTIISSGKIEHNLGSTLLGQGKFNEAMQMFENALKKKEKSLESNAESILKTKNSIGAVLLAQGKLDKAYQIFNNVYDERKKILGPNHSDTLTAFSNRALVLSKQGNFKEALKNLNYIKKQREKLFSSDHSLRLMGRLEIVDVLLMQGKYKEALQQCKKVYEEKKKFLGLQFDTLKIFDIWYALSKTSVKRRKTKYALSELNDALKERNKIYKLAESTQLVNDAIGLKNQVETKDLSYEEETYDLDFINYLLFQNDYSVQYSGEFWTPIKNFRNKGKKAKFLNCLSPSTARRLKREAASEECLFTWEDIDEFNDEKKEKRDINKINIDSEKFISYIKDLPEEAKNQLIELAAQSQVTGNAQGQMNKLISHKKISSHLDRVGKISRLAMDGIMAKNVLADFLNGDYEGVAINIGFIAGGKGLAKVAEAASLKGLKLIADNKLLLGSSLKVASSFLARGTSAFVVYDLVNQIKEYRNGSDDALVDIVGDSIYLGVDSAEIGVELAETFGLLEGVSSVTGPIGAAIGALIFVGTDVYKAINKVKKIDQLIHLTRTEKFVEGLRAFIGIKPRQYIEDLVEEKQLYNQLVKQGLEYLKLHHDIQNYVFPTSDKKFEFNLDSKILLDQKKSDVKWSRSRPDDVKDAKLFCLPHGNDEIPPSYGLYLCENAIGISKNEIGNYTLINLADGKDYAKGFSNSSNIFVVNNGYKEYYGGNTNDLFVLTGNFTGGYLYGEGGIDTLDLTLFARNSSSLDIFLDATIVNGDFSLKIAEMERILGRKDKSERIYSACGTMFLDGQGSAENCSDTVIIRNEVENNICNYNTKIVVRSNTNINNQAYNGEFDYLVLPSKGEAVVNITSLLDGVASDRHNFFFNSTISELLGISIQSESQIYDYNVRSLTFSFLSINSKTEGVFDSDSNEKTFNLIVSDIPVNASYTLSNGAQIKIGSKDNSYILEKTLKPVEDVLKDYLPLANRVTNMSFFIQSYLTNETIVIGSGNYEVIHNNPMFKSHLVGNGGENIYVIDSETENTPEIIIHDVDEEKSIDTIDLRNLVRKITGKFEAQIVQSQNNLLLSLIEENLLNGLLTKSNKCTLILKDGVKRYNKTHIIMENVPMVINTDGNRWNLRPQPLIFDKNEEIILITSYDVEEGNEIVTPRKGGNYKFLRGNDDDLIITNALDISNDLCSITLSKFYKTPKMKTLLIKFADLEISLTDRMEEINKAKDINFAKKEYSDQVYAEVFDRDPEVIMISDQPVTQKQSPSRQKREAHQDINNKYEPITWINNLFGWFRDSASGFLSSKPDETFSTESSISSTDISIDVNGTIMLIDMLIRKVTGQKYISSVENSISLLEAQSHSLNIIEEFKKIIEKAALRSGISLHRLNIDFLAAQKEVTDKILSGKWKDISKALITIVEKACPGTETGCPGRLSPKKFHYFKVQFQKEIDILLNQSIKQIVNDGGKVNENTKSQKIKLESESFLKNTTIKNRVTLNETLRLK